METKIKIFRFTKYDEYAENTVNSWIEEISINKGKFKLLSTNLLCDDKMYYIILSYEQNFID